MLLHTPCALGELRMQRLNPNAWPPIPAIPATSKLPPGRNRHTVRAPVALRSAAADKRPRTSSWWRSRSHRISATSTCRSLLGSRRATRGSAAATHAKRVDQRSRCSRVRTPIRLHARERLLLRTDHFPALRTIEVTAPWQTPIVLAHDVEWHDRWCAMQMYTLSRRLVPRTRMHSACWR